jgi:hypothetical protein
LQDVVGVVSSCVVLSSLLLSCVILCCLLLLLRVVLCCAIMSRPCLVLESLDWRYLIESPILPKCFTKPLAAVDTNNSVLEDFPDLSKSTSNITIDPLETSHDSLTFLEMSMSPDKDRQDMALSAEKERQPSKIIVEPLSSNMVLSNHALTGRIELVVLVLGARLGFGFWFWSWVLGLGSGVLGLGYWS